MSAIRSLFWTPRSKAEIKMRAAVEASERALRAAQCWDLPEVERWLDEADRRATAAMALVEPTEPVDPRQLAEQAVLCGFALSDVERSEPLDFEQREVDLARLIDLACWAGPYRDAGLPVETGSFKRRPTPAERRLFHREGLHVDSVEVAFDRQMRWLRLPLYSVDAAWMLNHDRSRREHLHVV